MFCANNISPSFSDPMVVLGVNRHIQKNLRLFQKRLEKGMPLLYEEKIQVVAEEEVGNSLKKIEHTVWWQG